MPYSSSNSFWVITHNEGRLMQLHMGDGNVCLPLFTSYHKAAAFIMYRRFRDESYIPPPVARGVLIELCEFAIDDGFDVFCFDPPPAMNTPVEVGELEDLIESVQERYGLYT